MNTAILVVDIINDFITGKYGSERAQAIVPRVKSVLDAAREAGAPVVYITDAHLPGVDREFQIWGSHAVEGTEGAEVVDEVRPQEGDRHLYKRRYSAFYATGLDALLRELGVGAVALTGVVTSICIQHTAADAYFRNYRVIVPRDCVEAVDDEAQEHSLNYMGEMYGAEITTSDEVIRGLKGG